MASGTYPAIIDPSTPPRGLRTSYSTFRGTIQSIVTIVIGKSNLLLLKKYRKIIVVIIKITISSIVIGLKNVVIRQFVIGQFVIGQFNKPITFKVVV